MGSVVGNSNLLEKSPRETCQQNNASIGVTAASGPLAGQEALAHQNKHAINLLHSSLGEAVRYPEGPGDDVIPPRPRDEGTASSNDNHNLGNLNDTTTVSNSNASIEFNSAMELSDEPAPGPSPQTRMGPNARGFM